MKDAKRSGERTRRCSCCGVSKAWPAEFIGRRGAAIGTCSRCGRVARRLYLRTRPARLAYQAKYRAKAKRAGRVLA